MSKRKSAGMGAPTLASIRAWGDRAVELKLVKRSALTRLVRLLESKAAEGASMVSIKTLPSELQETYGKVSLLSMQVESQLLH